jgi:hypothetical protein
MRACRNAMRPGDGLGHDAATEQLVRPLVQPGDGRHQVGIERLPGDGRRHDRGASIAGQTGRPQQHGVPHAVGQRYVLALQQLQTGRARLEPPARRQRRPELLHEEGDAVGPVEHGAAQRGRRHPQGPLQQGGGGLGPERLDRDLPQVARAAQLAAHPPDRVPPGQLVAPERPQDQQWLLVDRTGQRGQQLEGGVVGPLQVVQEQRRRLPRRDRRQRQADGLEQRRAVAMGRGSAELREQQRQVRGERPLDELPAARRAPARPQQLDDRPVRGGASLHPEALQDVETGADQHPSRQGGLADPGLAGEQDQRPTTSQRLRQAFL